MDPQAQNDQLPPELTYGYEKSRLFRVIYAEGAMGGFAMSGTIHIAFFSDRTSFPVSTTHKLVGEPPKLALGPEIVDKRKGGNSLEREIESDVVMPIANAKILHAWLGEQIALGENLMK